MRSGSKDFMTGFNEGCIRHYIFGEYFMEKAFSLVTFFRWFGSWYHI